MCTKAITRIFFVAALCMGLTLPAAAQSIWTNSVQEDGITIEGRKSSMDFETTLATSSWMVSGYYSVTPDVQLMGELGFSHFGADVDIDGVNLSESTLSNLYVGAVHRTTPELRLEAGVRVPLASEDNATAAIMGAFSDIDRMEAFLSDMWAVNAAGDYRVPVADDMYLRGRLGPSVFINTFGEETNTELYVRYALQGWYEHHSFRLGAGISGITSVTEEIAEEADRSMIAATASASLRLGKVEPGVMFQLPVTNDLSEIVDNVFALTLSVPLR